MKLKRKKLIRICCYAFALVFLMILSVATSAARLSKIVSFDFTPELKSWVVNVTFNDVEYTNVVEKVIEVPMSATANNITYIKAGQIAPGSIGEFNIIIDCTSCETDFEYSLEFIKMGMTDSEGEFIEYSETGGVPNINFPPFDFLITRNGTTSNLTMGQSFSGNVVYSAATQSEQIFTFNVDWMWPLNIGVDESEFFGLDYLIDIIITVTQVVPD